MHQRTHNLVSKARRSSFLLLLALAMVAPKTAEATTLSKLLKVPAFTNLVATIARVNQAMRSAAENPQDDWRRKNVRAAVTAMPAAIVGLALEFKAGRLHDGDLKIVQGLLGGFVDVNAADNYKKFMQHPSADLIPQVGSSLPADLMHARPEEMGSGSSKRLGFDDSMAKGISAKNGDATVGADPYAQNPDMAPGSALNSRGPASIPDFIASSASGMDDSRPRRNVSGFDSFASAGAGPVGIVRDNGSMSNSTIGEAARDLAAVESQSQGTRVSASALQESNLDSDLVLKKKKAAADLAARSYRIVPKPKYWRFGQLIHHAEALLIHSAYADQESCSSCKGGGGASAGGGMGGQNAAQTLFGLAAIMGAVAPAISAMIQANADQNIAQQQVQAQEYMTDKTVQNSQALAQISSQTALKTATMEAQSAQYATDATTQRQNTVLGYTYQKYLGDQQMAMQDRAMQNDLNLRREALAEKQADYNVSVARQAVSDQLTLNGMSLGTVASNGGLSVTPTNSTGQPMGNMASTLSGFGNNSAGSASGSGSGGTMTGISTSGDGSLASNDGSNVGAVQASAGQNLMPSLSSQARSLSLAASSALPTSSGTSSSGMPSLTSATPSDRLLTALRTSQSGVRGTSASTLVASKQSGVTSLRGIASAKGDISSFIGKPATTTASSFVGFRAQQALITHASSASPSVARGIASQTSGHAGAYNQP